MSTCIMLFFFLYKSRCADVCVVLVLNIRCIAPMLGIRAVTTLDFHYTIIMVKSNNYCELFYLEKIMLCYYFKKKIKKLCGSSSHSLWL